MFNVAVVLILLLPIGFVFAMISPKLFKNRYLVEPKRKSLAKLFAVFFAAVFVLGMVTSPSKEEQVQKEQVKQAAAERVRKQTAEDVQKKLADADLKKKQSEAEQQQIKNVVQKADKDTSAWYLERLYGKDAEVIMKVMRGHGLLPDSESSNKSKVAAILLSGYVSKGDDDPCYEGKNAKKCLALVKEALVSEKYKNDLADILPRVRPLPAATEKERKDAAWKQGMPLCREKVILKTAIPSTVDFSWGGDFSEYTDGTFHMTGTFTHQNAFGQALKKEFECKISLSKLGFNVNDVKVIQLHEVK